MTEQQTELGESLLRNDVTSGGHSGKAEVALVETGSGHYEEPLIDLVRQRHDYFLKIGDRFRMNESKLYVGESGKMLFRTIQNLLSVEIEGVSFHIYAPQYLAKRLEDTFDEASNSTPGSYRVEYHEEMVSQNIAGFLKQSEEVTINE